MTTLTTPRTETAPTTAAAPPPARRHQGCYWDHEQAAWVRYTPVPLPRSAQD